MIDFKKSILTLISMLILISCEENKNSDVQDAVLLPNKISVEGNRFVDNQGRHVILNGINVGSKNKEEGYIYQSGPELYKDLSKWGVNCIRLLMIWDGLEPEPGVYNEAYLKEIEKRIEWAGQNNIFVVLDMHQDLFSVKYSDGAPEWATLDEGKPHTTGTIWSDAYVMSEAVQVSFDNFWLNKPAPDGIGIQDHYSKLWRHIAEKFADNPVVIGYDIMNEPFPGSSGLQSTIILLKAYGELHYSITGEVLSEQELMQLWGDENGRMKALETISTKVNYGKVISQLSGLVEEFEGIQLQSMYQKVSNSIREVDKNHVIFLEHSYFGNTGVYSAIKRVHLSDGSPDPLVAYAPHGYDLVTDTKSVGLASNERVEYIYDQIEKKGIELDMPIWLGEWGAFYNNSESVIPVAKSSIGLIEGRLFGNSYWSYFSELKNLEYFKKILVRSYPAYVNGELLGYKNDFNNSQFEMSWREEIENTASTMVFVPHISKISEASLNKIKNVQIKKIEGLDAGWMVIPPAKGNQKRVLKLVFK